MNLTLTRLLAASVSAAVLAGCGAQSLVPGSARSVNAQGVEASKATLAKRLIVGFKSKPSSVTLAALEKAASAKLVKTNDKLALAVFESSNLKAARAALLAADGVDFVESELLPELEPVKATKVNVPLRQGTSKADPLRKDQYYLDLMGIPSVWASGKVQKEIVVAVVDTGVDLQHPDLKDKLVPGWNASAPGQPPQDGAGHGTMCAGLVGAMADNGQGISGIASNAKIMPVKVGNSASSVVDAMMWAADHADMITMSLSFKPNMSEYPAAVETTKRAAAYVMSKKIPMVCSMGNTGNEQKNVPSAFAGNEVPDLIAVGATDANDKVTSFSTTGPWCSVAAPGSKIITTAMGGGYQAVDGTSFSTPITAGVVALMLGAGHSSTPKDVKARLQSTAKDIDVPGKDSKSGAGRVDAAKAIL